MGVLGCYAGQILLRGVQVGVAQRTLHVDDRSAQARGCGRVEVPQAVSMDPAQDPDTLRQAWGLTATFRRLLD